MILHIIDSLGRGGAERMLIQTIRAIPEMPHKVITLHSPHALAKELRGVPHICLRNTGLWNLPLTAWRLWRIIRKLRPGVVHSHLFWSTIIGRLACPPGIQHVRSIHNMMSKSILMNHTWLARLERLTRTKKEITVCVSAAVFRDYEQHFGFPGEACIVRNFADSQFSQPAHFPKKQLQELRMVQLASLRPVKNQWFLLDAMEQLRDDSVTLDIYGNGPDRSRLQERIADQGLNVTLCGEKAIGANTLSRYDLLVAPSLHEGFGLAVQEALGIGLPVMISSIPAHRELAGTSAIYINPHHPDTMVKKVRMILNGDISLLEVATLSRYRFDLDAERNRFQHEMSQLYRSCV